jgi:hypothetical protein
MLYFLLETNILLEHVPILLEINSILYKIVIISYLHVNNLSCKNSNVKSENIYIIIVFTIEHYQFIDLKKLNKQIPQQ